VVDWSFTSSMFSFPWIKLSIMIRDFKCSMMIFYNRVKAWLGYPLKNTLDSFLRTQIYLFFHFSYDLLKFPFFLFMSNEIILFQILHRCVCVYIYITYENNNSKIYPMWPMFYQWPNFFRNFIFKFFLHYNRAFGFCHIHTFYLH